jgi:hypothetical protein
MHAAILAVCDITTNVRSPEGCGYVAADDPRFHLGLLERFVYAGGQARELGVGMLRGTVLILALVFLALLGAVVMSVAGVNRRPVVESFPRAPGVVARERLGTVLAGAVAYAALIVVVLAVFLLLRWAF